MDNLPRKDKSLLKKVTAKPSKKKYNTKHGLMDAGTNEARTSTMNKTRTRPGSVYDLKPINGVLYYWQKKGVKEHVGGNEAIDEEYSTIDEANLAPESVYHQNKELARQLRSEGEHKLQTTKDVCDDYGTMVTIFQSLIVKKVIIGQLLPYLTFIDDKAKWYCSGNIDQRKAMQDLIAEMLMDNTIGQWKEFIEALGRCGYSYIVENIKGYKVIDSEYQEQYLKILSPILREMIEPSSILPHLSAKSTINDDDKEAIVAKERNVGKRAATDMLLDRVPRKHALWYQHLLESFKETNRGDIAEYLDIPEMMIEAKQSKDVNPNDKRSQNQYSHMITHRTRVSSQERRLKPQSATGSHSLPVNFSRRSSEPLLCRTTQTISEKLHIGSYTPSMRHEISENSSLQYTALDLDQEYDDAGIYITDVCIKSHTPNENTKGDISSATSQQHNFASNIKQEQELYLTPETLTPPQSASSSDDELDELDEQVRMESKTLLKKEQKLEKIEANRKENLERKRSLDERKANLKALLNRAKNATSIHQGTPINVEESKECKGGSCKQNGSKTRDLKSK